MFPDGCTGKATKKMLLKHNLRQSAQEMNIVPGLHSALVSIPKLADAGYTTVFNKNGAAIYNDETTNPNAESTLECEGSTSTQQHCHQPQKPKQHHMKGST
jgi:hypothetical protein